MLRTKLFVPPLRADHVPRLHLITRLNQGLRPNQKLTLVSAPAGYGKTTLLSQWVDGLDTQAAWLSLDAADDDLERFWTYIIAACQTVLDGIGESAAALLASSQPVPGDTIPTLLINDLLGQTRSLILILDDYRAIQNPSIHESVAFLVDYQPDNRLEEILRRQPEDVQSFLLHTAILERLTASLCEETAGRQDSQAMLAALHRENLFLISLDSEGHWFRYHHLFADLLQARLLQALSDEAIAALHRRAATSYRENGLLHEAIKHALAAGDFEHVASLLEE